MKSGIGSHHSSKIKNDEWLTPPEILKGLGQFDLDPCAPVIRPWDTAKNHYTIEDNGLLLPWNGRVFCNPPYGSETGYWLDKLYDHGNGIALIFARTETSVFFNFIWNSADSLLFIKGRLYFYHVDGSKAKYNSGGPSVLIAYGNNNSKILKESNIKGKFINLKS